MTYKEQLERLYSVQEQLRVLQENGLWEVLETAKSEVIKVILDIENTVKNSFNIDHWSKTNGN